MRNRLIFVFIIITNFLFSQNRVPIPKYYKLYTEFISYRKMKYLKKESIATGYIAMDGKDKFIYKQKTPFIIEIKKKGDIISYKRENANEIIIDISDKSNSQFEGIVFLKIFNEENVEDFIITKRTVKNIDYYEIIPKKIVYIDSIKANGIDDKLYELIISYKDGSTLRYEFKNTETGINIDEKLF